MGWRFINEGEKSIYSKQQAETVLRDFFQTYVARDFQYIHQGSSPEGLKYTIGRYTLQEGSFRVYMLLKQQQDQYLVNTISFTRE